MLPDLLAFFGRLGYDVVEMVLADQDDRDRYEAAKWLAMRRWLEANPDDELAEDVRARLITEPVRHATFTRDYLGWGVFALTRNPENRFRLFSRVAYPSPPGRLNRRTVRLTDLRQQPIA